MNFLLALFLLAQQLGHRSNPSWSGLGDPVKLPATITSAGSGNCPGTGCVAVAVWGATTWVVKISGTWNQTLQFSCTNDNWATVDPMAMYALSSGTVSGTGQTTTTGKATGQAKSGRTGRRTRHAGRRHRARK